MAMSPHVDCRLRIGDVRWCKRFENQTDARGTSSCLANHANVPRFPISRQ
jgi:hypothetical protein